MKLSEIKTLNAWDIFHYVEDHSTIIKVLARPCSRIGNFKSKIICAVKTEDEATYLADSVNAMAAKARAEIDKDQHAWYPGTIHYAINVVSLDDPNVILSIRDAEKVQKVPCNKLEDILPGFARPRYRYAKTISGYTPPDPVKELMDDLHKAAQAGKIDLTSSELARIARRTGRSYRLQAFSHDRTIQQTAGDLCILVYRCPADIRLAKPRARKTRSDAGQYNIVAANTYVTVSRYRKPM